MEGYTIAQQNCYRCHNMGAEGGQMASIPWPVIGALAKGKSRILCQVRAQSAGAESASRMAASPEYDDQTIAALQAYFSTFAAGGP